MIPAVLLAAGKSERMGAPKPFLDWEGATFLETIVGRLDAAGADEILVATRPEFRERIEALFSVSLAEAGRNGRDGRDGRDGQDGQDGPPPLAVAERRKATSPTVRVVSNADPLDAGPISSIRAALVALGPPARFPPLDTAPTDSTDPDAVAPTAPTDSADPDPDPDPDADPDANPDADPDVEADPDPDPVAPTDPAADAEAEADPNDNPVLASTPPDVAPRAADAEIQGILVCLVDHPGVRVATYATLLARARAMPERLLVPVHDGRRGHPVYFPAAVFADLMRVPRGRGADYVLERALAIEDPPGNARLRTRDENRTRVEDRLPVAPPLRDAPPPRLLEIEVDDPAILRDIDTPADYARARRRDASSPLGKSER